MPQDEEQNFKEMCGFKVDNTKNLYRKVGNEFVLVQKLKKDIYKMISYENTVFYMDTFGDCFVIREEIKFLFGILSQPAYFNILNNRIYSVDKYSRVWVHDLEGEILNISFLKENIKTVNIRNDYCSVTTDGKPVEIDYNVEESEKCILEKKLMIFDRSFALIRCQEIEKVVKYEDSYISVIIHGKAQDLSLKDHSARKSLKLENL